MPFRTAFERSRDWFSWRLLLGCFALLALPLLVAVGAGLYLVQEFGKNLPSPEQLRSIQPVLSTKIYDHKGRPFGEYFVERRTWVRLDSMPPALRQAVIAIEDRQFYNHWGIHLKRLAGAAVANVARPRSQGASTITQQLARNLFLNQQKTLSRKIREALTAVSLERYYTKNQLFSYYLNQIYLGGGAYGMQAASLRYFGKNVWELDVPECALLGGLIQKPEGYRPDRNPKSAKTRRDVVLRAMRDMGYISEADFEKYKETPVVTSRFRPANSDGAYFLEAVRHHIERTYGEEALYHSGLVVHATVDGDFQLAADSAVERHGSKLQRLVKARVGRKLGLGKTGPGKNDKLPDSTMVNGFDSLFGKWLAKRGVTTPEDSARIADSVGYYTVQVGLVLIENKTGAVRALVGGRSFETSKFNRALQAMRQTGSTFKPFVYAAAIEQGASPADLAMDAPVSMDDGTGKIWAPQNYDHEYDGAVTLRRSLMLSKNMPTIQVILQYGVPGTIQLARRLGIKAPLPNVYAISLGAGDATLLEMTSAYSAFANLGVRYRPYFIDSVLTRQRSIRERTRPVGNKAMDSAHAYVVVDMLRDVIRHGTGYPATAQGFTFPAGGKTGTTDDYTDSWFIGFTRLYTLGVWVGFDQKKTIAGGMTGARGALPIWIDVMKSVHKSVKPVDWPKPSAVEVADFCVQPSEDGLTCLKTRPDLVVKGGAAWARIHGQPIAPDGEAVDAFGNQPQWRIYGKSIDSSRLTAPAPPAAPVPQAIHATPAAQPPPSEPGESPARPPASEEAKKKKRWGFLPF